eukprot:TRINITY_DN12033_c0_g1_i12.p1 TRINITY_DN12033_c0_g1~~TRINITY_DN12033_c0_g1_i12.p1  ORF type:complete len:678 (+),score=101.39 TRINITY_DN12033_c0_g1_i12:1502-3535(+)
MVNKVQLVIDIATAGSPKELDTILTQFTDDEQHLLLTKSMYKRGTLLMSLIHNRKPVEVIEHAISKGAAIDFADPDMQMSALTMACKQNAADVVELLLRHGADQSLLREDSVVLSVYAHGEFATMAQILLEHTTSKCSEWPDLPLLLDHALALPDPLWLELLLQHGLDVNHLTAPSTDNQLKGSLLQIALKQQAAAKVDLLLRNGADISEEDLTHYLLEACQLADFVMLRALLTRVDNINTVTQSKSTPIHAVCHRGNEHATAPAALALLIAQGADVNLLSPGHRATPLFEVAKGSVEMTEMLISAGADVNIATNGGTTPLHRASKWGRVDVMQCLLEAGAYMNAHNRSGNTALHLAASWGKAPVALLLEHGADANIPDDSGKTPIYNAIERMDLDSFRLLVVHGASLTIYNKAGSTPMHAIMAHSMVDQPHFEQLLLLCIETGAFDQPDKINARGFTPLMDLAGCMYEASAIRGVDLLIANGADRNAGNRTYSVFSRCAVTSLGRRWLQQQLDQGWKPSKLHITQGLTASINCGEQAEEMISDLIQRGACIMPSLPLLRRTRSQMKMQIYRCVAQWLAQHPLWDVDDLFRAEMAAATTYYLRWGGRHDDVTKWRVSFNSNTGALEGTMRLFILHTMLNSDGKDATPTHQWMRTFRWSYIMKLRQCVPDFDSYVRSQ